MTNFENFLRNADQKTIDEILDQISSDDALVYELDCLELHPEIAEQINNSSAVFILQIFALNIDGEEIFMVWSEDGDFNDSEDLQEFGVRASFYSAEADARVGLADEYQDWQSRF